MSRPKQLDFARLAAYIDSEGCISFKPRLKRKKTPTFNLVIEIGNTDVRIPLWCKSLWGGSIQIQKRWKDGHPYIGKDGSPRKAVAYWNVSARKAEKILTECMPFFLAKREQAEIGLAFRETYKISTSGRHGAKAYPEVFEKRLQLVGKLKEIRKNPPLASIATAVGE